MHTLFPVRIWEADNVLDAETNAAMAEAILDWRARDGAFEDGMYPNGYTSYHGDGPQLYEDPRLEPLARAICREGHAYMTAVGMSDPETRVVNIASMFCNINGKHSRHGAHRHERCEFSGVYYVRIPEDAAPFTMHSPMNHMYMHTEFSHFRENALWCRENLTEAPRERQMRLFPSWLLHEVEPQKGDGERLSIAFNCEILLREHVLQEREDAALLEERGGQAR